MCRSSHRLTNASDGTLLELPLPDAVYRYDEKDVAEIPNGKVVASNLTLQWEGRNTKIGGRT